MGYLAYDFARFLHEYGISANIVGDTLSGSSKELEVRVYLHDEDDHTLFRELREKFRHKHGKIPYHTVM